jgi:hypothetical protein
MNRSAIVMMGVVILASADLGRARQEPIAVPPVSQVQGGKVLKAKTMTAVGGVKAVTAETLSISDGRGKDWTFAIDGTTKNRSATDRRSND